MDGRPRSEVCLVTSHEPLLVTESQSHRLRILGRSLESLDHSARAGLVM